MPESKNYRKATKTVLKKLNYSHYDSSGSGIFSSILYYDALSKIRKQFRERHHSKSQMSQ